MKSMPELPVGPPAKSPASFRPRAPRYDVSWRARLNCPDWGFAVRIAALNASQSGLFLGTLKSPAPGTRVELSLALPNGKDLNLRGTVCRVVTPEQALSRGESPGAGIQIDAEHDADMQEVSRLAAAFPAPDRASRTSDPKTPTASGVARRSLSAQELFSSDGEEDPGEASDSPEAGASVSQTARAGQVGVRAPRLPAGPVAPCIGVDFGTSYTRASVAIGDRVYMIPDAEGVTAHPSVVFYPEGGAPVVGAGARAMMAKDPRRIVGSAKRLLGHHLSDPEVSGLLYCTACKLVSGTDDAIAVEIDGKVRAIDEVCAEILRHLRGVASQALGTDVQQAVLTCPAAFGDRERAALRKAAEMAGLRIASLVDEPVAGGLAYGMRQDKNEIVAVYDFGGGTFDFSVIDFSGDRHRVLASAGDAWLGGDDFDAVLASAAADRFWQDTHIELRQRVVEWERLVLACEGVKRELSRHIAAELLIDDLIQDPGNQVALRQGFERATFEGLCQDLMQRSLVVSGEALEGIGLGPRDVTQVVAIGGISRIPFVRRGLGRFFGREILHVMNPDEAVALGAGLCAAEMVNHPVVGCAAGAAV
jgi:hypothetical protein